MFLMNSDPYFWGLMIPEAMNFSYCKISFTQEQCYFLVKMRLLPELCSLFYYSALIETQVLGDCNGDFFYRIK